MNVARRTAFVPADRLPGWVARFSGAHGALTAIKDTDDGVMLRMHDGSVALLSPPWPDDGRPGRGTDVLERLTSLALQERRLGIVLVRRGGYAVGVAVGGQLLAHKVGTASVRSRGADQGTALVEKAVAAAGKVFSDQSFEYFAAGGDTKLLAAVLSTPAMRTVADRPQLTPLAVTDPNMAVLQKAAADFCSLRIQITDP